MAENRLYTTTYRLCMSIGVWVQRLVWVAGWLWSKTQPEQNFFDQTVIQQNDKVSIKKINVEVIVFTEAQSLREETEFRRLLLLLARQRYLSCLRAVSIWMISPKTCRPPVDTSL